MQRDSTIKASITFKRAIAFAVLITSTAILLLLSITLFSQSRSPLGALIIAAYLLAFADSLAIVWICDEIRLSIKSAGTLCFIVLAYSTTSMVTKLPDNIPLLSFLVFSALVTMRIGWHWTLLSQFGMTKCQSKQPDSDHTSASHSRENQFSLRGLLLWVLAINFILASLYWLKCIFKPHSSSATFEWIELSESFVLFLFVIISLVAAAFLSLGSTFPTMPLFLWSLLPLADSKRRKHLNLIAGSILAYYLCMVTLLIFFGSDRSAHDWYQSHAGFLILPIFAYFSVLLTVAITFQHLGYRLDSKVAPSPEPPLE